MGSRAKLANVPKLHELIQHQVRRILEAHRTWTMTLPSFSGVDEAKNEARKEVNEVIY
jgi:maintenance of mitochondrial morphology protein 1